MTSFVHTTTEDGTFIAHCPRTVVIASGLTLDEAVAALRRLTGSHTYACAARHPREGIAA